MSFETREANSSLLELIEPERWLRLQTRFSLVLGVGLRTISPSKTHLVDPTWPAGTDSEKLMELLVVGEELEELFPSLDALPNMTTATTRPLGYSFAAVPLKATAGSIVGYLVVGPIILGPREDYLSFQTRAAEMGFDPEQIWRQLLTVKTYTYSSFKSLLSMLEEVTSSILELAYQSKQLKAIVPATPKVDQLVLKHYTTRIWHSLLDIACTVTKAEGGSVMLYESESRSFRIAAAHGLREDLVKAPRLEGGNNIAAYAIEKGEILLLDENVQDPELRLRMRRPEIASSLVAPFSSQPGEEPIGVLNLRTTDYGSRFSADDIELLRKLMQLAQTVFSAFRNLPGWTGSSSS